MRLLPRLPRKPKKVRQQLDSQVRTQVPPGQFVTDKFPVLSYASTPHIALEKWRFQVFGLVGQEREWSWEEFLTLPNRALMADFHCVTQWSRLDNAWEGVPFTEVIKQVSPLAQARHVMVHCYDGYTTNLRLDVLLEDDVIFAHRHDGQSLPPDHGGPMRLVVPKRYAWKSAKWVKGLEFMEKSRPGFWEQRGYHMEGEPWGEERFSSFF